MSLVEFAQICRLLLFISQDFGCSSGFSFSVYTLFAFTLFDCWTIPGVMTCLSFLCGRRLDSSTSHPGLEDELSGVHNVNLYSYKELKIATEDFSPANKIGEGGFGSVFKGKLRNGQMAAIKVLSSESRQGVREFLTEIQVISDVDHVNLVKLYGCCVEGKQRILVYNYLENNSLAQTLLGGRHGNIYFNWRTRVKICIGVARGLAYLHEEVRPHIVHRDIKASNILLDKDLTPKISDFGLAKLMPANLTHVSTRVAGTIGYLAPEYAIRGQLTRRADIYSFGVLLIEIVSGRNNTNTRLPVEEQYILERTWQLYEKNELVALVDTSLNGDFDAEQACRFLQIGLLCTQDSPKLRPSMSTVVQMLTGEKSISDQKITKPGLISDFMDLKVKNTPKQKPDINQILSNYNSSGSDTLENTTSTSPPSSLPTMTFTSVYDRSM
ncbi:Protein kinase superfamily protein [Striga hermonthica]|uniref:Protein kinase superfamily protein n=1 Tax=Striga hermonthica TaxID=68872 RepID=A0A9N7NNS0_STRHE|nr:Protein kinase superfamily protein [Striga hermonthica]